MNIFLLSDPRKPTQYAMFSVIGTWSESPGICKGCGDPRQDYIEPLQIEWEYGTDRIGDFSWKHYNCLVVDKVKVFLKEHAYECTFGEIEFVPLKESKSRMPRVAYPYPGPHLSWLRPIRRISLNEEKSKVYVEKDCPICGQKRYTFKREGIHIDKAKWNGEKMFRIDQNGRSGAMFIVEPALRQLEGSGFTNMNPSFAGVIE